MAASKEWNVVQNVLSLAKEDVEALTGQLNSFISEDEVKQIAIDAIKGKVNEDCFKGLKAFAHSIAYDGFNPQTVILEMAKRAKNDKTQPGNDFVFNLGSLNIFVSRTASLAKDVQLLATLFLVRGNNLFKILKTVEKNAKEAIEIKRNTYNIKSDDETQAAARKRKEKVILASTDITLSRVAASFPHITLAIAKESEIPGKAELAAISLTHQLAYDKHHKIPEVLHHGLLPALLCKSMIDNEVELRNFCYMFNLEQTITLQPAIVKKSMINESISTQMEQSIRFVDAAINGPMITDKERLALRKGLFVENDETKGSIDSWIKAGSNAWIRAQSTGTYSSLVASIQMDLESKSPSRKAATTSSG